MKEENLKKRMLDSNFVNYVTHTTLDILTPEEEKKLFLRIKNGDLEAKEELIKRNLRLVISIAKKYANRGLDFDDLIQEGNIGLMKAIDKFDLTKKCKFSTYATWWIFQTITRAIDNKSRTIRISLAGLKKRNKIRKTIIKLNDTLKRNPTIEEIAKELKISENEVNEFFSLQLDLYSVNDYVGNIVPEERIEIIPSKFPLPNEEIAKKFLIEDIEKLFKKAKLSEKEIIVLRGKYGLNNQQLESDAEIGKKLNCTKGRINQIKMEALKKLRLSAYIKEMVYYMEDEGFALENLNIIREYYKNSDSAYLKIDFDKQKKKVK